MSDEIAVLKENVKQLAREVDALRSTMRAVDALAVEQRETIASLRAEIAAVRAGHRDAEEGPYYGNDCPKGMVQVEFVGCPPGARYSDYGWRPVEHAFIEVWVDGKRFRIDVGDFHDGEGQRRGLHIVTELGVAIEKTSMNAASLYFAATSPREDPETNPDPEVK